jgi:dTDP-4-amino-4,6-dideoxygalactose transaminase
MQCRQTPCFSFNQIIKNGKSNIDVFPLNSKNSHYLFGARYAIWMGIKILGITPEQNILMPAYNCGTELDPIIDQNIQIKYYRVKLNMMADLDDMKKQVDSNTAAIFTTHYLGFAQPIESIRDICNKHGLFLIEDCAHAFLSKHKSKDLGTFSDISVFSLRKTLPIPNGGVLVINNGQNKLKHKQITGSLLSTIFVATELLINRTPKYQPRLVWLFKEMTVKTIALLSFILRLILRVIKKISPYKGLALTHINYYWREFQRDLVNWKMSTLSDRILKNSNFENIKEKRRRNFEYLIRNLSNIKNIKMVYDELPEGVCPLFLPTIVRDRLYYYRKFKEKGISTFPYWEYMHNAVPWKKFPDAVFLKQHLLGLPIHQDITLQHLDRLIEIFMDIKRDEQET